MAAGEENGDAAVAAALLAAGDEPAEVYGDSAYGTGDLRAALQEAGTRRSSSPGRSSPPSRAGSPSMTSPSMRPPGPSPARPASPGASPHAVT
jgi:hypothetical protein